MKILDVGPGIYPIKGADSIDYADLPNLTYKHNLNKFPYPIRKEIYDLIYCSHTLEHLEDPLRVLSEFKRILKDEGRIIIKVPYLTSNNSFQDLTHIHHFTYFSFDYFAVNPAKHIELWFHPQILKIKSRKLHFYKKGGFIGILSSIFEKFANKNPIIYENVFKYIFPAREIEVVFEKTK